MLLSGDMFKPIAMLVRVALKTSCLWLTGYSLLRTSRERMRERELL